MKVPKGFRARDWWTALAIIVFLLLAEAALAELAARNLIDV